MPSKLQSFIKAIVRQTDGLAMPEKMLFRLDISSMTSPTLFHRDKGCLESKIFLGRDGEPHELHGAFLYLASDATAYTTGANPIVTEDIVCPKAPIAVGIWRTVNEKSLQIRGKREVKVPLKARVDHV